LPDELTKALRERQSMGIVGDIGKYAQYQAARSIPDAAKASGGLAGAGVGLAIGQQLAGALAPQPAAPAQIACASCGKSIDAGSPFCRHCGKPQKRACPQCG